MSNMYKVTSQADDLFRDKIACNARSIVWRCDELSRLAMYPDRIMSQIKYNVEQIKKRFKTLQSEMNEPEETFFSEDVRRD